PSDIAQIPGIIKTLCAQRGPNERKIWETDSECRPEEIYHTGFRLDKDHAFVVISEGCSNFCSYCVVPYTRGPLRHRGPDRIIDEIRQAVSAGITRVTLLGQNVNSYQSKGVDFAGLLEKVNEVQGLKEFSFVTSHPRDTSRHLFETMAALDKCRKYLHLPVQSGSDRVLKLMNRGYTRKNYLDLSRDYRTIVSEGQLTTDIIVGFSTEKEEDFLDTYKLVEEVRFDAAFIFKYSPRPHSASYGWQDDVPKEEKERRHALVLQLQKKISLSLRKKE
ncbi:MAG: MiaB/RimO family radical SAM methylthiotransferase, partial [Deltaproteobacteria bacterium]